MITHLILDGVAESSLGVGIDIVGAAARLTSRGLVDEPRATTVLRQHVVSLDGQPVRSGAGRPIAVDGALNLRDMGAADVLVIPGWFASTESSIGRLLAEADGKRMTVALERAATQGIMLAASCSATFALAASGVLDGQNATTAWWLAPEFARRFPAVSLKVEQMVVEADHALTAGSAFAHADLMLAVIARAASSALAQWVARYLALDHRPSQARYMVMEHLRISDPAVQKAERFITQNLHRQITLDELAHAAAVSSRTLARRMQAGLGMTPNELVQRLRVSHAAHLLETSHDSVETIAARVGYADPAAFRRVFRRVMGESPRGKHGTSKTDRRPCGFD
ncbi:GlxA family transcriptional regulator [Burkholderia ubonensis]|uniref:Helix-turn-helix domain-containing protein n=1 Tax=Burkholderia ubonensis TaxID=101571 RepID=A0AB74CZW5_9BURK|nr:helix-turn-helix domain-containing protein [Burkholderia ubonensis]PAJ79579.1 AraC family transcriptional regulator [Burkholderia ubonensis]PAJ86510.1 AraC family transcriptional regulator [Burkholderia ubonensis]PAJ93644.1 AraC family transcriptional regulator [Burkholderia ubonensis]PAK02329.1 AraC family transcriptional regulator [Burkholderia ubonensis]PAK06850.1 AraC family transcriptional regulator [Burkholderia ubonensis]